MNIHNAPADHSSIIANLVHEEIEKGKLVEQVSRQQARSSQEVVGNLAHRQQQGRLSKVLGSLHFADVARVIEKLSPDDRLTIWEIEAEKRGGDILLELPTNIAEQFIRASDRSLLNDVLKQLDTDEVLYLGPLFPEDLLNEHLKVLNSEDQDWFKQSKQYDPDSVGAMMDQDMLLVHEDDSIEQVRQQLKAKDSIPPQSDKLFVVDKKGTLKGILNWSGLVINDEETLVSRAMTQEFVSFQPQHAAEQAASAFERYNLVSAPVINHRGKPVGRLRVDVVMDFIRDEMSDEVLNSAGLSGEEDLFAPIWHSAKNRWLWLSLSLITALFASRVIGLFEDTISHFVALAALMPIVAAVGGNTGNQTTTLVVRGLALAQITKNNQSQLISKELRLSLLNGLVWGSIVGIFSYIFYGSFELMAVIATSMVLTLILAAILGLSIPLTLQRLKRDPALGSNVLVTALTDSIGFFIFLSLASIFLVR